MMAPMTPGNSTDRAYVVANAVPVDLIGRVDDDVMVVGGEVSLAE